jgi:hypothetical protein
MLRRENSKGQQEFFWKKETTSNENLRTTNLEEANQFVTRTHDGFTMEALVKFKKTRTQSSSFFGWVCFFYLKGNLPKPF